MSPGRARLAAAAIAIGAACVAGCTSRADGPTAFTQPVTRGVIARMVLASGTLNPVALINVGANVSGTLKWVRVDYNDRVVAGQLLAEIDDLPYRAQADQSEAAVRTAQAVLASMEVKKRRDEQLFRTGFLSASAMDASTYDMDAARARVSEAQAALRRDRANLRFTRIYSPVSGVVISRLVSAGQTVAAAFQTPVLFVVAPDLRKMQIEAAVAEADIGAVRQGQRVEFSVDAFPDRTYEGRVLQVRNNFATIQSVVTYTVVIDAPNADGLLRPGMTANVRIDIERREHVLRIPNAALRYAADKPKGSAPDASPVVFRLAQGRIVAVEPQLGLSDGKYTEVLDGSLREGDRVVIGEGAKSG